MAKDNQALLTSVARNSLVKTGEVSPEAEKLSINGLIQKSIPEFTKALIGSGGDGNRFARICTSIIKNNKDLAKIAILNPMSIIAACLEIAAWGLDPSIVNEVFLIPYGDVAKAQAGYKGLAKLVLRSADEMNRPLVRLNYEVVFEDDEFDLSIEPFEIRHKRDPFADRGKAKGYYAHAEDSRGMHNFFAMSVADVAKHQSKFCKSLKSQKSPFYNGENFDAYGLKSVLRGLCTKKMTMSNKALTSAIVNDIDGADEPELHGALKITARDSDIELKELENGNQEESTDDRTVNQESNEEGREEVLD